MDVLRESLPLQGEDAYQRHVDKTEGGHEGEADEDGRPAELGTTDDTDGFLPDVGYVLARLLKYNEKLAVWNDMEGRAVTLGLETGEEGRRCVRELEEMASGYKALWARLSAGGGPGAQGQKETWELIKGDLYYLEGGCDDLLQEIDRKTKGRIDEFASRNIADMRALIEGHLARGEYQQAISAYENLAAVSPGEKAGFTLTYGYAKALIHSGRLKKARAALGGALSAAGLLAPGRHDFSGEEWEAVLQYADLLLVVGDEVEAKQVYSQLDDFFAAREKDNDWVAGQLHFLADYGGRPGSYADYVDLLALYIVSDGRGVSKEMQRSYDKFVGKYSDFGLLSGARRIMRRAEEQARRWGSDILAEAKTLAGDKNFHGAKLALAQLKGVASDLQLEAEQLSKRIAQEEQFAAENARQLLQDELANSWQDALALLDQKQYEAAIAALSKFLTSERHSEAKLKRDEAVRDLADQTRRQAADLFVKARTTGDIAEKKELYRRSRLLLVQFLKRYPGVAVADKIVRNLAVLDEQIKNFDPGFWEELDSSQKK